MKITLKAYGALHTIAMPDDSKVEAVIDAWLMMTESAGFSPKIVTEALQKAIDKRL